jgi:hypothetical protein
MLPEGEKNMDGYDPFAPVPPLPLAEPPAAIAKALWGRTTTDVDDEAREIADFKNSIDIPNHLAEFEKRKAENRLSPPDEDAEERAYYAALTPLQRLFHPAGTASTPSAEIAQRFSKDNAPSPEALQKRFASSARKIALTDFVRRSLALGETVESLATYAARTDPQTADLIRQIGAEL